MELPSTSPERTSLLPTMSNADTGYPFPQTGSLPTSLNRCLMERSHGSSSGSLQEFRSGVGVYTGVGAPVELGVVYGVEGRLEWSCCVPEVALVNKTLTNVEFNSVSRFSSRSDFEGCVDLGVVVISEDWFAELLVVANSSSSTFVDEFRCSLRVLTISGFSDWVDLGNVNKGEEWLLFVSVSDVLDLTRLLTVDVLPFLLLVSGLVVVGNKSGSGTCFSSGTSSSVVSDGRLTPCSFSQSNVSSTSSFASSPLWIFRGGSVTASNGIVLSSWSESLSSSPNKSSSPVLSFLLSSCVSLVVKDLSLSGMILKKESTKNRK